MANAARLGSSSKHCVPHLLQEGPREGALLLPLGSLGSCSQPAPRRDPSSLDSPLMVLCKSTGLKLSQGLTSYQYRETEDKQTLKINSSRVLVVGPVPHWACESLPLQSCCSGPPCTARTPAGLTGLRTEALLPKHHPRKQQLLMMQCLLRGCHRLGVLCISFNPINSPMAKLLHFPLRKIKNKVPRSQAIS